MWKKVKLDEIVDISIGKTPSRGNKRYWDNNKDTKNIWLSIADMKSVKDGFVSDSKEYLSDAGAALFKPVPANTLIMSFKLSIGKLAFTYCELRTNEAIAALAIKNKNQITKEYLRYFLSSLKWDRIAGDAEKIKGKTLNKAKLKELEIILPPLIEQQRIVAKLDTEFARIDDAIEAVNSKVIEVENLKASLLNDLTSKNIVKLQSVCEIYNGGTPKSNNKSYWDGEIQWLTPKDMGKLSGRYVTNTSRKITIDGLNNSSAKLIPSQSVILSCRAPIGHVFINEVEMSFNQGCKGLVPKNDITVEYLYYFLFSSKKLLNDLGTGTTFKEISGKVLANVPIPLPSILEQKSIVAKLDTAFSKLETAKSAIVKSKINYQKLKSTILQQELQNEVA